MIYIVLLLKTGVNFPLRPGENVLVRTRLQNVVLKTSEVSSSPNPDFECELVWESTREQLAQLKAQDASISLDVFIGSRILGHAVLSLKSCASRRGPAEPTHLVPLEGGKRVKPCPSIDLALFTETASSLNLSSSAQQSLSEDPLEPEHVEDEGYLQIGDPAFSSHTFLFDFTILQTSNLEMLSASDEWNLPGVYRIKYELLGMDYSTEIYQSLDFSGLDRESATATLRSNPGTLATYFTNRGVEVNICRGGEVIGTADVDVGKLLNVARGLAAAAEYRGEVPVVAASTLSTPRDGAGKYPSLLISLSLVPTSDPYNSLPLERRNETSQVSEGELSDTLSVTSQTQKVQEVAGPELSRYISSASLQPPIPCLNPREKQEQASVQPGTPKPSSSIAAKHPSESTPSFSKSTAASFIPKPSVPRLGIPRPTFSPSPGQGFAKVIPPLSSQQAHLLPPLSSQQAPFLPPLSSLQVPLSPPTRLPRESTSHLGDETDYISPPPVKHRRLSSPQSPPQADVKLPRKYFIHLRDIRLLQSVPNLFLSFCYTHIHRHPITTEGFPVFAGELTPVLNGSTEFNFLASQVELLAVFREYRLRVQLYAGTPNLTENLVGSCSVNMEELLHRTAAQGVQNLSTEETIVCDSGVIGYLSIHLELHTYPREGSTGGPRQQSAPTQTSGPRQQSAPMQTSGPRHQSAPTQTSSAREQSAPFQANATDQPRRTEVSEVSRVSESSRVSDRLLQMEMLSQAAKELETWKNNEKRKYSEQLVKVEAQHLALLGREWQAREKERVDLHNIKVQDLEKTEELLTARFKELQLKQVELEKEKRDIEAEQRSLKANRLDGLQKLKKELKARELELIEKTTEIQVLKGSLKTAEQELKRVVGEKEKKRENLTNMTSSIDKLKQENTELAGWLELAAREAENTQKKILELQQENITLKNDQMMQLRHLSMAVSKLADVRPVVVLDDPPTSARAHSPAEREHADRRGSGSSGAVRNQETQVTGREESRSRILEDIQRMERDKEMMLRAGYNPDAEIIQMFQKKIDEYYKK